MRDAIRTKHYSYRTEQAYVDWITRFILFHNKRHPAEMGTPEVQAFITFLAVERHVSASTQKQALGAVLFLYRNILEKSVEVPDIIRPDQVSHLPTVLSHAEALAVIDKMSGISQLMAKLLYGSGLRLMECLRLRVKDVDFGNHQLVVRDGKGEKDRLTVLPDSLVPALQTHLEDVKALHQQDLQQGFGEVSLPYALARKYPNAPKEWPWQYVFPASQRSTDPLSGKITEQTYDQLRTEWQEKSINLQVKIKELEFDARRFLDDLEVALALMANLSPLINRLEEKQKQILFQTIFKRIIINTQGEIIDCDLHSPFAYLSALTSNCAPNSEEGCGSEQVRLGAYNSDKTSQTSVDVEEFLAGLRFEQRGKLKELPIAWSVISPS